MYDVVIIGAGPAGLFAAYELITKNKDLKVAILERGNCVKNRICPMTKKKVPCQNCNPCAILSGYGGAGTFSDGKLNFIPKIGKSDLMKYMSESEANELINNTEKIFNKFGMDSKIYPTNIEEAENSIADMILLDAGAGDGTTFDWEIVREIKRPYFLAGGLDADNAAEAVNTLRPYALDVSSGIETSGLKDKSKMAAFVSAVRKEEEK